MDETQTLRVVIIPFPAFGHMIPHFHLSIALAKKDVQVFFVSTPRNIQRLPQIPQELSSLFKFVEIPFPDLHKEFLPKGVEATMDTLNVYQSYYLLVSHDLLQQPVKKFIVDEKPDYIITDMVPWTIDIARECHIPLLFFSIVSSAAMVFYGPPEYMVGEGQKKAHVSPESFVAPPEWIQFPSTIAFREFEASLIHQWFYRRIGSFDSIAERMGKVLEACQAVITRSCLELEGNYLVAQEKMMRKPVIPIGLLPRHNGEIVDGSCINNGFKWLDEQRTKSVLFVGFGSECKLTRLQVHEIAYGLELSGLPFFWTLRNLDWAHDDLNAALPLGFAERTTSQGLICTGWTPQVEILAHPSIGGALFHAGWGSVIEILQFGHCLVVLPVIFDQPLNAKLLVEKHLALEVEVNKDGSFNREYIADSLQKAMLSEEGQKLRDCAKEAASIVGDLKLKGRLMAGVYLESKSRTEKRSLDSSIWKLMR